MAKDSWHRSNAEQGAWRSETRWWEREEADWQEAAWWEREEAGLLEREAEESSTAAGSSRPEQHSTSRPKHSPPGRGCRARRREERDEQGQRNNIRGAFGMEVSAAPIQTQIRHERFVRKRAAHTEKIAPQIVEEANNHAKAQQLYSQYLVNKAAAIAAGKMYYNVPPPQSPWIPPTHPSSSSSAPPPKWSHTSCCPVPPAPPDAAEATSAPCGQFFDIQGPEPKTPPTPPEWKSIRDK